MADVADTTAVEEEETTTVLCVDDERNILTALRRLLRPKGYRVLIAQSGAEALEMLEKETVDLVISDMRMPEMDGAQFLTHVAQRWPDIMRLLLTGYADLNSTVAAINKGQIYRYLSKPWEDQDIYFAVERALEHRNLQRERDRLIEITKRQNEELMSLNANLEEMVKARTQELEQTVSFLEISYNQAKSGYRDAIPVFAHIIELREGSASGHARRVAEFAGEIGKVLGMEGEELEDLTFAGLLHDVGKLGMPDDLLAKPHSELTEDERAEIEQHPVIGEGAFMSLPSLAGASKYIRAHHERFDGKGYPDGLAGQAIPLGARILGLVNDYDDLQCGRVFGEALDHDQARAYIEKGAGVRYDPQVVQAFLKVLEQQRIQRNYVAELKVMSEDLKAGMVITRDLTMSDGMLLLAKGRSLTEELINRIAAFENSAGRRLTFYVHADNE